MTCRAPGSASCTNPTPTGQSLTYDPLGQMLTWQSADGTASGQYADDGEGDRVWQRAANTSGGVTTTTTVTYVLGVEEITSVATSTGGSTTTTAMRYYGLAGGISAERDASGLSYLAHDLLGTPILTYNLDTGAIFGGQLRTPYGQARYADSASTNGGMHTSFGFTGQREDSAGAGIAGGSGLDDFHARSYDPAVGRFTSADSVSWSDPLGDAYAYVGGMVEVATDPSGNRAACADVEGPCGMGGDVGGGAAVADRPTGAGEGGGDGGPNGEGPLGSSPIVDAAFRGGAVDTQPDGSVTVSTLEDGDSSNIQQVTYNPDGSVRSIQFLTPGSAAYAMVASRLEADFGANGRDPLHDRSPAPVEGRDPLMRGRGAPRPGPGGSPNPGPGAGGAPGPTPQPGGGGARQGSGGGGQPTEHCECEPGTPQPGDYVFYHGTTVPSALDIIKNGINPAFIRGGETGPFFTTQNLSVAQGFAASQAARTGDPQAIVEFWFSEADWNGLVAAGAVREQPLFGLGSGETEVLFFRGSWSAIAGAQKALWRPDGSYLTRGGC